MSNVTIKFADVVQLVKGTGEVLGGEYNLVEEMKEYAPSIILARCGDARIVTVEVPQELQGLWYEVQSVVKDSIRTNEISSGGRSISEVVMV